MAPKRGGWELGGWASWVSSCWSLVTGSARTQAPASLGPGDKFQVQPLWVHFPLGISTVC